MRVLAAAESLHPPSGGAERFLLEALPAAGLDAEGLCLRAAGRSPSAAPFAITRLTAADALGASWVARRARADVLGAAAARRLAERPADVVVTQLHATPAVVAAARAAGVPVVVVVPSYESLCKHAFDAASACSGARDCAGCPVALDLPPVEAEALRTARAAQHAALRAADALVAPSAAVAAQVEAWLDRRPTVVAPVVRPPATAADTSPQGAIVAAPMRWSTNKGAGLLEGLAEVLRPELAARLRVVDAGLPAGTRGRLAAAGVDLRPPSDGLAPLLDGAAVLLVPSQWPEPFGRVAWEAAAAGVPVLGSAVGGLPETVAPGGLVAAHADPAAWAAALDRIAAPAAWERARDEARACAARVLATDPPRRLRAVLTRAAGG